MSTGLRARKYCVSCEEYTKHYVFANGVLSCVSCVLLSGRKSRRRSKRLAVLSEQARQIGRMIKRGGTVE